MSATFGECLQASGVLADGPLPLRRAELRGCPVVDPPQTSARRKKRRCFTIPRCASTGCRRKTPIPAGLGNQGETFEIVAKKLRAKENTLKNYRGLLRSPYRESPTWLLASGTASPVCRDPCGVRAARERRACMSLCCSTCRRPGSRDAFASPPFATDSQSTGRLERPEQGVVLQFAVQGEGPAASRAFVASSEEVIRQIGSTGGILGSCPACKIRILDDEFRRFE